MLEGILEQVQAGTLVLQAGVALVVEAEQPIDRALAPLSVAQVITFLEMASLFNEGHPLVW